VLPFEEASRLVASSPALGRYSLAGFHNEFMAPGLASADAHVAALWQPAADWWRLASTNTAARSSCVSVAQVLPIGLQEHSWLATHVSHAKRDQMAHIGLSCYRTSNMLLI
jgi:hypothetical protein